MDKHASSSEYSICFFLIWRSCLFTLPLILRLCSDVSLTASDVGAMSKADVDSAIAAAQAGAAVYQGAAAKESDIGGTAYKQGWYWVVSAAGTYCGEVCEPGDMVFCNKDKGGAFSASDFDVVQANIQELTASEVEALLV